MQLHSIFKYHAYHVRPKKYECSISHVFISLMEQDGGKVLELLNQPWYAHSLLVIDAPFVF